MTPNLKDRLRWLADAKKGDALPDWMGGPAWAWAEPLSATAQAALDRIEELEKELASERLRQHR